MNELDPTHQAVAEAARARVMELIGRGRVVLAEIIMGDTEDGDN